MSKPMLIALVIAAAALAGCANRPKTDTPIGDYGAWGKCAPGQCAKSEPLQTYRCVQGGTEILVRGAKNPDPQTCKPVEHL